MTEYEQELENKRKIERLKNVLIERKAKWDEKHKGVDAV
jgi:hypothetical protein